MTREKSHLYRQKRRLYREKRMLYIRKKLWRKDFRWLKLVFTICVCVCLAASLAIAGINAAVIGSAADNITESPQGYEIAVVFGAKVHEGGTLSHMLQDRMDTAIALYHSGAVKKLLVSGDGRGEWSETKYMRLYAIEKGVSAEDIIEDGEGFSTMETVSRASEVFGLKKCVLVTQKYHLYRAVYAAESMGMDVSGVSADVRTYYGQLYRDIREIMARVKDFVLCIGN
jgi:vancomycin permeability regulator SanA